MSVQYVVSVASNMTKGITSICARVCHSGLCGLDWWQQVCQIGQQGCLQRSCMVSNMTFGTSLTVFPDGTTTRIAKETAGSVEETVGVVTPLADLELWPGIKLVTMR